MHNPSSRQSPRRGLTPPLRIMHFGVLPETRAKIIAAAKADNVSMAIIARDALERGLDAEIEARRQAREDAK